MCLVVMPYYKLGLSINALKCIRYVLTITSSHDEKLHLNW